MNAAPYREPAPYTPPPERIVRRLWWSDGPFVVGWVPFQTYVYASHGCWTIPTEPWVIVEERPS